MNRARNSSLCDARPRFGDSRQALAPHASTKVNILFRGFRRVTTGGLLLVFCAGLSAAEPIEETVSFRCGLAIDAVIAEMDSQAANPVTQQALSRVNEKNGQFVCVQLDPSTIYVRLQSTDMNPTDNKLVFTVDTSRYRVLKTYYGP